MAIDEFRVTGYRKKQQEISQELSVWKKACPAIWFGALLMAVVGKGSSIQSQEGVLIGLGAAMFVAYLWREKALYKQLDVFRRDMTEEDVQELIRLDRESRDRVSR